MKKYHIKEIFYSLQGEGFYSGRPSVFIRFSGCNLWNGKDRSIAVCKFCDTDFVGTNGVNGGVLTKDDIMNVVNKLWVGDSEKFIVLTGGEPLLQVDTELIKYLKGSGCYIAVETNGTIPIPFGIDWVCVSPKTGAKLKVIRGDELKLVYPQNINPEVFLNLTFSNFYLQPKEVIGENNVQLTLNYCLANPKWKLSLQTHKYLNIQ